MIDKDDELAQRVSMLFYGNHPTLHCNRLPGWAQLSDDEQSQWRSTAFHIERLMREAVLAERERCAVIMDERATMYRDKATQRQFRDEDCANLYDIAISNAEASEWGADAIRNQT